MANMLFNTIEISRPKLNAFDLSHDKKMSLDMGLLIPIQLQEVLPSDVWQDNSEVFIRFAPMLAPVMHRAHVRTYSFFVPNRLVWDEWQDFITGGEDGMAEPVHPYFLLREDNKEHFQKGKLADYLGIPPVDQTAAITDPFQISALPFRAYQLIYNEYFRDQNLQAPNPVSTGSGEDTNFSQLNLRYKAWEKDYFTSALPWAQRGAEVTMPISGDAAITYRPQSLVNVTATGNAAPAGQLETETGGGTVNNVLGTRTDVRIENLQSVEFQNGTSTINDLRRATKLQTWLEKMARAGSRYIEQMLVMFGVRSSDARLQRPEMIGAGKTPVVFSEVLSTFQQEAEGLPQGNMSGHGIAVGQGHGFKYRAEEHGFIIQIMCVLPVPNYQQGINRLFSRFDRFDYFWKDFANIGEQEIRQMELYYDAAATDGTKFDTFGYQSRYAEYKYCASTVHGDFRDNLSYWHMGRIFEGPPALNDEFIVADPTKRIFAVTDPNVQNLYCMIYHRVKVLRPLPYYGTPQL